MSKAGGPPGLSSPGSPLGADGGSLFGEEPIDVKQELLTKIGGQVQKLLAQAKTESEAKVKAELRILHTAMQDLDARLDGMLNQLEELNSTPTTAEAPLEQASIVQALAKVEQQWGKELNKLKGELHQTIFAHNHNADLMKHQKETLDQIRTEIDSRSAPVPEKLKAAKAQLLKIEQLHKAQQRQRRFEPILQRMAVLEQKVAALWRWPGMMGQNPSVMAKLPGMQAASLQASMVAASQQLAARQMLAAMARGQNVAAISQADEDEDTSLEQVLAKALAAASASQSI